MLFEKYVKHSPKDFYYLDLGCPATFSARIEPYGHEISEALEKKYQILGEQHDR